MTSTSYVIQGGHVGRQRLRVLSEVMAPTTGELLDRLGLPRDARCLDAGCGGGDVTRALASRVPDGSVVGIDLDAVKLEAARDDAERLGLRNVEYRLGDVTQPLDGHGTFDVVFVRFVLCHLRDPQATLRHLIARLVPDGLLIAVDVDMSGAFCHPPDAAFQRSNELFAAAVVRNGGDPHLGRRLPLLLREAALEDVGLHVVQPSGWRGEVKRLQGLTLDASRDAIVAAGLAGAEEIDAILQRLHALAESDDTVIAVPRIVQTWGWKP
jgi:SAM-dependent methyltransferase